MRLTGAVVVACLAIFGWRNGPALRILLVPPFSMPAQYFIGGDAQSQCTVLIDKISHKLDFCEDVIHWDQPVSGGKGKRRVLASCDPSRRRWNTVMGPLADPNARGALWVYAPGDKQQLTEVILEDYPAAADFHPLGIDIYHGSALSDPSRLIVVNHGRHNTTVEQFFLSPSPPYRATHVRTLTTPAFVSPNSVAFTSSSSFYVTQDHRFTRRLPGIIGHTLPMIETLLLPGLAWVDHVEVDDDGNFNVTRAANGIPFANGVAVSSNGKKVAVASSSQAAVHFYNRMDNNELKFEESVLVPFAADNIGYEADGSLSVAGHPHFPTLANLAASKRDNAPSWAVSIIPRVIPFNATTARIEDDGAPCPASSRAPLSSTYQVKTLYQSNGTMFSSSTTAVWDPFQKDLYITGLYEEGILHCHG